MAASKISHVKYCGVSACVPKTVLKISDYDQFDAARAEQFSKQTGIRERRFAKDGLCSSDMCLAAAEDLIAALQWDKSEISALIYVSQSMDYPLPATACILQDRLGLPKSAMAFDVGLGCSGYVYGLGIAGSMIGSMKLGKVLLLAGDNSLSRFKNPLSTSIYPLFGDAGTATALSYDESAPDIFLDLCTDGGGFEYVIRRYGGVRHPIESPEDLALVDVPGGGGKMRLSDDYVAGPQIMEFCIREVKPSILRVLELAGESLDGVDFVFAHQANRLINETVRKMAKIPPEKHPYNMDRFGNTSVSSLPLLMVTECSKALSEGPLCNLLAGFGVGLSWGSVLLRTDKIVCPPLREL